MTTLAYLLQARLDAEMHAFIKSFTTIVFSEVRCVLAPSIEGMLGMHGKLMDARAAELRYTGLGTADFEQLFDPNSDGSDAWQDSDLSGLHILVSETQYRGLYQSLFKHRNESVYYFVATDGESGVYTIDRLAAQ